MTLWCERGLQGGRNSGRAVARMSSGACAPRSARACMRSSEVGSAQCRSSNASTTGCERAPARNHATRAASCRRRNSSGANFAARSSGRGMSTSGASQGRIFGGVEADQPKRILEVGEAPVGRLIRAEALATPFGDRVQRRILQELRRRQFDKGVRRLTERRAKLLHEARLADAGFADNERELARAIASPIPAPAQQRELLLAPDEGGQRARAAPAPAAARAHDPEKRDRRRTRP